MAVSKIQNALNSGVLFGNNLGYMQVVYKNGYCVLKANFNGNNSFTEFVFYDNGKVTLERYADGEWKSTTTLRPAD